MAPPVKVQRVTPALPSLQPAPEQFAEFVRDFAREMLKLSHRVQSTESRSKLDATLYLLHMLNLETSMFSDAEKS